jgi:hypothetical protein
MDVATAETTLIQEHELVSRNGGCPLAPGNVR